jgi:hypothetical protein
MSTIRRGLAVAALVPLLTGLAACSGSDDKTKTGTNASGCGTLPTADPAATLPAGFPTRDQVLYEPSTQGSTKVVYALVDESSFLEVRDDLVDKLKKAGYTIDDTDQESVEAEAEFSGPQKGTIKVEPKCAGHVTIRYKFEG